MNIQSIVHPTDFSDLSRRAMAHALRVALATKSQLHILHVREPGQQESGESMHIRRLLDQWGLIDEHQSPREISAKLGVLVSNVSVEDIAPARGILRFLDQHATDLVVLATHGREGLERLWAGSIAETVFHRSAIPTLFVPPHARGFVGQVGGEIRLRRVLVPIDHAPTPARAVEEVRQFAKVVGGTDTGMYLLHLGTSAPVLFNTARAVEFEEPVILRSGSPVLSILEAADEFDVDLIGMPTAGHNGVLDALRGTTTERVLRRAPCPVLAVPA